MSETQTTQSKLLDGDHSDDEHKNVQNGNSKSYKEKVKDSKDKLWRQIRCMILASLIFSLALFGGFYLLIK